MTYRRNGPLGSGTPVTGSTCPVRQSHLSQNSAVLEKFRKRDIPISHQYVVIVICQGMMNLKKLTYQYQGGRNCPRCYLDSSIPLIQSGGGKSR